MIAGLSVTATVYFDKSARSKPWPTRAGTVATHPLPSGERVIVTIGVMMAVLLQVLDTTIANVALPHMAGDLSATQDTINWVLTSYIVASAIALPISGWLADKVGRKRLLLISVVGVHRRVRVVRDRHVADRDGRLPRASGRQRRLHRPACPGDLVRHQPARKARPGDGLVRRRRDDRPDPRPGARRLADRQLQLALGVPGQPARRHPVRAHHAALHAQDGDASSATSTCSASPCWRSRLAGCSCSSIAASRRTGSRAGKSGSSSGFAIAASWMFVVHMATAKHPLFERKMFADRNFATGLLFMAVTGVLLLAGLALLPPLLQNSTAIRCCSRVS